MRNQREFAVIVALFGFGLGLILLAQVVHAADATTCARMITKASAKYVQTRAKVRQKCEDARLRGRLPASTDCEQDPSTSAARGTARARLTRVIGNACGGGDGTCGTSDDLARSSYGWGGVAQCPSVQGSACAMPIETCADVTSCLACLDEYAVGQTSTLAAGSANESAFGTASMLNRCQRVVVKATAKFLGTTAKALGRCWDARLHGQHANACPVPGDGRTATLLARAEQMKVTAICRACGGVDRVCDGSNDFSPTAIGFTANCPSVTVPDGSSCAASVSTLSDLVDCVDCVATFHSRCTAAAAVPGVAVFPPECSQSGTSTSTTQTPVSTTTTTTQSLAGTFLDFTTTAAGGV